MSTNIRFLAAWFIGYIAAFSFVVSAHGAPVIKIKSVERTAAAIVIKGKAAVIPPGTVFTVEVLSVNGKQLGERHIIKTVDKVAVDADGTFEAQLQRYGSLGGFAFPKGQYRVEFFAYFNTAWQSPAIARSVGVDVDAQGRTGLNTEPRKLPPSEDLKIVSRYGERYRVLQAIRTVAVGDLKDSSLALGRTREIRLEIHDTAATATRNPVRSVKATDMLFREVKQAVGWVAPTQAVVLACIGPFPAGYIANDLFRPGGRVNASLGADYATTLREICDRMEQQCRACASTRGRAL
jgi:hypothetical protein